MVSIFSCASYISDKRLITRIYRELKKLNSPKINAPIKKWATELNRTFSKEEIQMAKKHRKSPLTLDREKRTVCLLHFSFYLKLLLMVILTGLKDLYSFLHKEYINHIHLLNLLLPSLSSVTSP
jgi:hypothetical protein